jgi:hypothetical protein
MGKLPQVFLVITVLGLGVTYGHYDFRVERGYRGSYVAHLGETFSKFPKKARGSSRRRYRAAKPQPEADDSTAAQRRNRKLPEAEKTPVKGGYARRTFEPEREEAETPKHLFREYQVKLDVSDRVIMAASTYRKLGVMNAEKRQEYARKILDSTEDTLRMLDELNEKFPGQPEIEERLQEIHRLRHFATKELGAR